MDSRQQDAYRKQLQMQLQATSSDDEESHEQSQVSDLVSHSDLSGDGNSDTEEEPCTDIMVSANQSSENCAKDFSKDILKLKAYLKNAT